MPNFGISKPQNRSITQDYKEAFKWYLKAAEQGVAEAQYNLSDMYENGRGIPKSLIDAYMWLSVAGAYKERDLVAKKMTTVDISRAKELALEFVNENYYGVSNEYNSD